MKKINNFSRQIKVVNSYLAYNRNIFTNFLPWKNLTIFSRQIKVRVFFSYDVMVRNLPCESRPLARGLCIPPMYSTASNTTPVNSSPSEFFSCSRLTWKMYSDGALVMCPVHILLAEFTSCAFLHSWFGKKIKWFWYIIRFDNTY